jgi:hypothetical protein
VTGTVESKAASSAATSTTAAGTTSSSTMSSDQKLKVSSVRMISADCSSK